MTATGDYQGLQRMPEQCSMGWGWRHWLKPQTATHAIRRSHADQTAEEFATRCNAIAAYIRRQGGVKFGEVKRYFGLPNATADRAMIQLQADGRIVRRLYDWEREFRYEAIPYETRVSETTSAGTPLGRV